MGFGFFGQLAKGHGKKALQQVTDAVVALDPKVASEAQLLTMTQDLQATAAKLAEFRIAAGRERREADEANVCLGRMQAAGEKLYADMQIETDPAKKAALTASLQGLGTKVLELRNELQREEQEASEAEALVKDAEDAVARKSTAINEAKTALKAAIRELDRAKIAEANARERAEHQKQLAGLSGTEVGGLNSALSSLTKQAEQARISAESHRIVADSVTVVDPGSTDDPNVLAALAAIESPASSNDMAALFGPKPAEALKLTSQ